MYNSHFNTEIKPPHVYRWANPYPNTYAAQVPLFCNGNRCKRRHWKESRESRRNYAQQYARAVQTRLEELDKSYTICTGCLKLPKDATLKDWQHAKKTFARYLRRWKKQTGYQFEFIAYPHISLRDNPDTLHYDWIVYHNIPRSEKWVRTEILTLWHKLGGTNNSSLRPIDSTLETACNYTFKFLPDGSPDLYKHMRTFPLANTSLSSVWTSYNFWGCKSADIEVESFFNGEHRIKVKRFTPMKQYWRRWLTRFGDNIPYFETEEYREAQQLSAELETLLEKRPLQLETSKISEQQHNTRQQQKPRGFTGSNSFEQPLTNRPQLQGLIGISDNPDTSRRETSPTKVPDKLLDKHNEEWYIHYWLKPIHRDGKPTGTFQISINRDSYPAELIKTKQGRSIFNQEEIEKIVKHKGWMTPRYHMTGWHVPDDEIPPLVRRMIKEQHG